MNDEIIYQINPQSDTYKCSVYDSFGLYALLHTK